MELALISPPKTNVLIVEMKNKPQQALAMENPKLKDYPEEDRKKNIVLIVKWLLDFLGVKDAGSTSHHNELVRFINSSYLDWTFQEIKLAFEMYVKGDLTDENTQLNAFQSINSVVFGRVMKSYRKIKMDEMSAYFQKRNELMRLSQAKKKKLTDEEKTAILKAGVKRLYKEFEALGVVPVGNTHLYDYLYEKNLLTSDVEEKKKIYNQAKEKVKNKYQLSDNSEDRKAFKIILERIENGMDQGLKGEYKVEAKRISIENFMNMVKENDGLIDLYLDI